MPTITLPVVSFTKRDDLFTFGHRPHANYRRPFVGSHLRHSGFSLRASNSTLSARPRFRNPPRQPRDLATQVPPLVNQTFGAPVSHTLATHPLYVFLHD